MNVSTLKNMNYKIRKLTWTLTKKTKILSLSYLIIGTIPQVSDGKSVSFLGNIYK